MFLEVDGSSGLVVGMQSKQTQEVMSGALRLALGGVLIDKERLIVQVQCVNPPWDTLRLFYPSFSIDSTISSFPLFISLLHLNYTPLLYIMISYISHDDFQQRSENEHELVTINTRTDGENNSKSGSSGTETARQYIVSLNTYIPTQGTLKSFQSYHRT